MVDQAPNVGLVIDSALGKSNVNTKMNVKAIMLAEGIRPSPLDLQVGFRAPLLPVRSDARLIDEWSRVLRVDGIIESPIEVVMASHAGFQSVEAIANDSRYERTIEPRPHRGTSGVLADLQRGDFEDSDYDYLLVIESGTCPPRSIRGLVEAMNAGGDVILGASEVDRFAGVLALKPKTLALVPDRGYHDLKEQTIPKMLEAGNSLSAVPIIRRAIRVRTLEGWLEAVRSVSLDPSAGPGEDSRDGVEGDCCIAKTARINGGLVYNSIVMDGAVVEEGAIVARSAVLPGQRIRRNARVVDSIVGLSSPSSFGGLA